MIRPRRLSKLASDLRGAAMIEFAICAGAFMALMIAALEIALAFFAQQALQSTAEATARKVLTGEAATARLTAAQFKALACTKLPAFLKCANLMVDVTKAARFADLDTGGRTLTYDGSGQVSNSWRYDIGGSGDVVILRLMYVWQLPTGPLGFDLGDQGRGVRLLVGTMVFKTEAYS